jgi:MFS family permease
MVAPRDIRHSAQSFIIFVTYGIGNYIGSLFAGWIHDHFTIEGVTNWTAVFLIPCLLTILCALAFLFFFKPKQATVATGQR